ncbi:MAG: heavy metal translocating P-type ATPase [Bacillota bacterium]|nr:heavy metal translocating P-type ATPase [Bacillota bacterium]
MVESISLRVYGMTCTLCSITIESALEKMTGIKKVRVSYASEKASLEYDDAQVDLMRIKKQIESLGFSVEDSKEAKKSDKGLTKAEIERNKLRNQFIFSAIFSAPLMLAMVLGGLGFCHDEFDPTTLTKWGRIVELLRYRAYGLHDWRFQLTLGTIVQFTTGLRFYKHSYYALKAKSMTMDLLVALGSSASYFYSVYIVIFQTATYTFGMRNIYFEASTTIITLVLLGKYLESKAKNVTSKAIESLVNLQPKNATIIRDNIEIQIPIEQVIVGDTIVVKPGEKIPTDGIILEGYSTVDESMLTGESIPIEKHENDLVTGASINKFGTFKFKATNVGEETKLAHIIKLVDEAQESKAPIQKIADKVSGYFIPFVLFVSLYTFIVWYFFIYGRQVFLLDNSIIYAVSVLVVSCPCALGLATPAAIMVGIGIGAKHGILIKNGEDLEKACKIDTIVLDKTGTITTANLEVTDIILLDENNPLVNSKDKLIEISAIAEKQSEHPLGKAIYEYAKDKLNKDIKYADKFEAVPGNGITALIDEKSVVIGTKRFLTDNDISILKAEKQIASLQKEGKTVVIVSIDKELAGVIAIADQIKESSKEAIERLKKLNIQVYMLTGDNYDTANKVAKEVGIDNVIAEVQPENKAQEVAKLKSAGKIVAMVGDGINDAPALATADLGIAVGSGTDVAIETGDIVLLRSDLRSISSSIKLSKLTMRKIKQNLFWAFIYNIVGIPIAATGHLNPVVASVAMCYSSLSVLLNSLSLKRSKL